MSCWIFFQVWMKLSTCLSTCLSGNIHHLSSNFSGTTTDVIIQWLHLLLFCFSLFLLSRVSEGYFSRLPWRCDDEEGQRLRPLFQRWKIVSFYWYSGANYVFFIWIMVLLIIVLSSYSLHILSLFFERYRTLSLKNILILGFPQAVFSLHWQCYPWALD